MEITARRFVLPALCIFAAGTIAGIAFADPALGFSTATVISMVVCVAVAVSMFNEILKDLAFQKELNEVKGARAEM
jgi:hypothetical protein